MYIIWTENVQAGRLHLEEYLKLLKKCVFFFFLRTNLRKMCCFFACLKNKRISNDLEKEFNTSEVEAMGPSIVRIWAFQMT